MALVVDLIPRRSSKGCGGGDGSWNVTQKFLQMHSPGSGSG